MRLFKRRSKFFTRPAEKAIEALPKLKYSKSPRLDRSPKTPDKSIHEIFPEWLLEREDFQQILQSGGINTKYLNKACMKPYFLRNDEEKKTIFSWLKSCPFSKTFRDFLINEISKKIHIKFFSKNEVIIHEGDVANEMYLIVKGKVAIFHNNSNKEKCRVGPMNSIGDIALETGHL